MVLACWTMLVSTALPPWALTMINPAAPCSVSESAMSVTIAASVVAEMLRVLLVRFGFRRRAAYRFTLARTASTASAINAGTAIRKIS